MTTQNSTNGIFIILLVIAIVIVVILIKRKLKTIKIPAVFLITGAVKTGKTFLSVHLAIKQYKKNLRKWRIKKILCAILRRDAPLKPMLYSNIPLRWTRHNQFTIDILLRKVRIPDMSVVLLDEASLVADSMLFGNKDINAKLLLFVKLFSHYSHGGNLIINTQAISDLHYSFKRSLNNYLFIYSHTKLPFITIMKVREMIYSDDNNTMNDFHEDLELSMRTILVFNKNYRKYDSYCYSIFTDELPYQVKYDTELLTRYDSLKTRNLVTLQDFKKLLGVCYEDKKNVTSN